MENMNAAQLKHAANKDHYHDLHSRAQSLAAENDLAPPIPRVTNHDDLPARLKALQRSKVHILSQEARLKKHTATAKGQLRNLKSTHSKAVADSKKTHLTIGKHEKQLKKLRGQLGRASGVQKSTLSKTISRVVQDIQELHGKDAQFDVIKVKTGRTKGNLTRTLEVLGEKQKELGARKKSVFKDIRETAKDAKRPTAPMVEKSEARRMESMPKMQHFLHRSFHNLEDEIGATVKMLEHEQQGEKRKEKSTPRQGRAKKPKASPPSPRLEPAASDITQSDVRRRRHKRETREMIKQPLLFLDRDAPPPEIDLKPLPAADEKTKKEWDAIANGLTRELRDAQLPVKEIDYKKIKVPEANRIRIIRALEESVRTGSLDLANSIMLHGALGKLLTGKQQPLTDARAKEDKPATLASSTEHKFKRLLTRLKKGDKEVPWNQMFPIIQAIGGKVAIELEDTVASREKTQRIQRRDNPRLIKALKKQLATAKKNSGAKKGILVKSKRARRARSLSPPRDKGRVPRKKRTERDESPERLKAEKRKERRGRARSSSPRGVRWKPVLEDVRTYLRKAPTREAGPKKSGYVAGRRRQSVGGKSPYGKG
jgi:hypothetical protein